MDLYCRKSEILFFTISQFQYFNRSIHELLKWKHYCYSQLCLAWLPLNHSVSLGISYRSGIGKILINGPFKFLVSTHDIQKPIPVNTRIYSTSTVPRSTRVRSFTAFLSTDQSYFSISDNPRIKFTISDWNSISAGGTVADSDRMIRSLELKTAGNGHFDPHFGELAGFECNLNDQSTSYFFDLHYNCEVYSCCDIKEVPISSVRIWTFTLTPTTLHIYCRSDGEGKEANVEVMSVSYSTLSHCIDSDQWASLLNILTINSDDEVTSAYRGKRLIG